MLIVVVAKFECNQDDCIYIILTRGVVDVIPFKVLYKKETPNQQIEYYSKRM